METRLTLDIGKFLDAYEMLPCLWDRDCSTFKNREARNEAEIQLMMEFGIPDQKTLRRKIRSIRGVYNTEIRKIKDSVKSGASSDVYTPRLSWFANADRFLRCTTDMDAEINLSDDHHSIVVTEMRGESDIQGRPENSSPAVTRRKRQKHNICKNMCSKTAFASVHSLQIPSKIPQNEFMVFGQHVGLQLNDMAKKDALELQLQISNLILKKRIEIENRNTRVPADSTIHLNTQKPDTPMVNQPFEQVFVKCAE